MEGPRAPLANELPSLIDFLDQNLRPQQDWSIRSEYPMVFNDANSGNIRIISRNGELLSHAVMRPLLIKSPAGLFKVAGIGSVVTSEAYRNQGLSTKTLESCIKAAADHGCDFAILWTDLYDFYRKLDFELAGSEISFQIPAGYLAPERRPLRYIEGTQISSEAILRLYNQHTVISLRRKEEIEHYLRIPNSRVATAWDENGQLKAYAVEGKGLDLDGYIHEWGGMVPDVLALLEQMVQRQRRPLTMIVPRHSQNLIRNLEHAGLTPHHGFLGMVRLLNKGHLFRKIKRYSRQLGIHEFALEAHGPTTYIGVGEQVFKTDSDGDIVRLIFGPSRASEMGVFDAKTAETLDSFLPLPLWIWGWDSI